MYYIYIHIYIYILCIVCVLRFVFRFSVRLSGLYKGTSLRRNVLFLGPYSRPMPRILWWSYGGCRPL